MQDKKKECQNSENIFIDKQKSIQQIENNNYEKFQTLDSIFDKKVGMGKYQYLLLGSVSFSNFIEGIEGTLSGLYPGILKNEWELGDSQIELIGSFYYIGQFLGFATSSILADNLGRKNTLLLNTIVMFLTNIATLIYGFLVGNIIPVTSLIIGEMIPSQHRGRGMIFVGIFLVLGKIYCLVMASFFMDSIQTGKWRQLTLISAFPVVILFFVVYFFCDESPRLLIMKQAIALSFMAGVAGITSPVIPFLVYYLFTLNTYFVFYFSIALLIISIMAGLTIVNFISKQEQIDKCYEDETNQSIQDPNEYFNQNNLTN
ncbi:Major facilitator superfamily domain, general substrate transporter [Pseudocohnilembus persalinus]|uniref:Major facilitator superfamily domain, general substrate transporter n=1 Tax=Pseudocohnilembus persalinus TaxID=266149 RepID=A0A0V0R2W2_PSEPJ|nr:Major facilitator superfamily domain, general substrate transporter [Pseudocohnilembus persalinus]|eukprot:KRX08520.1 Major facilitator superfamily domain, general substrate transporter [Pseudocohnilembus persalinus]